MQIQATYNRSDDSLKLLETLNDIDAFRGANLRILFNSRSAEDQKILQLLATSMGKGKPSVNLRLLKTVGLATVGSLSVMVYGLVGLFGSW